jgi:hypothetical protein
VIFHDVDRSARSWKDWAIIHELKELGFHIYFSREGMDMDGRGNMLTADIKAAIAADQIRNLRQEVKKSIYALIFTLLGIIVMLSIVFLLNTNQSNQKGYVLQQQQIDKENFLSQNRELIEKIIQAQAYKTIQEKILGKNMVPPESLTYITDPKAPQTKPAAPKKK